MKQTMKECIPDLFFAINQEAKSNAGEDSYCYSYGNRAALLGVFDGCGGLGAQRHAAYSQKTEAYMASRLCAGGFFDSFQQLFPNRLGPGELVRELVRAGGDACAEILTMCSPPKDGSSPTVRGSMVRTLPSTAAVALVQYIGDGEYSISPIWAGDSRVYLLSADGLFQLTMDDTTVPDPMENLYRDGILRNVLSEGSKLNLHSATMRVHAPFCVFAATDGCFGYFSTPMEFEGMLLQTLSEAASAAQWEADLSAVMHSVAGDDYTLCLAAYGLDSFAALQNTTEHRLRYLQETYLNALRDLPITEIETRRSLWKSYGPNYLRYIKG